MTPILQTYLDICKVHIEHYSRARVMTKALHIGTKTDSETTPDSETRDSETGRRIQKINVVFRNYFVVFKNYCVGFGSYPWYSATIRSIQKPFRRIQKRNVVFRNNFVVFKNYFVGFRHNPWYSETIRSIRDLFSSDSETARVE
jgi:hypothetical protein